MDKSPDAFRTISEVADSLDTPAHVLRFWESRFPQIKPVKRAGGRRYYRPADVALLTGIKRLLHDEGLTIRGVQKILRDQGVRHVAGLSDESVSVDAFVPVDTRDDLAALPDEVPEAGFIAIEDEPEPDPEPPAARPVVLPLQPSLFDRPFDPPPALARGEGSVSAPKKPTLPDTVTFSSLIRQLPRNAATRNPGQLADVARRLAALRARMVERAEGGIG
ncbi:MAG: MerR family transcriptional regulator [Tabrizicola sp.]|uniref:MerR family transcriptional regulator n=1 Tax=Tabrizicola sp. TaxID=2005166 RepID=UPI002ABB41B8|nr:MerR family transcriptional regulator [Tabrizicola sp.]MDZ4086925.1 MerR family transcriptional regulator [Tabrizicola sp.]